MKIKEEIASYILWDSNFINTSHLQIGQWVGSIWFKSVTNLVLIIWNIKNPSTSPPYFHSIHNVWSEHEIRNWFELMSVWSWNHANIQIPNKSWLGLLMKRRLWNIFAASVCASARRSSAHMGTISWCDSTNWYWRSANKHSIAPVSILRLMCGINQQLYNHLISRSYPINPSGKKAKWAATN